MAAASEIGEVSPGIWFWQGYDPAVKADLCSTAVSTADGLLMIDPIALTADALQELTSGGRVAGIIITNSNHLRAAPGFAERFDVPIYAHADTISGCGLRNAERLSDGDVIAHALEVITIDGAAAGEIALYAKRDAGSVFIGDALINFGSNGFTFLPPKYCSNAKQMRQSLRRLLDCDFDQMFFAHGTPIVAAAKSRFATLLDGS
jgi:glyoxylase-like metal-dependent hydrolase (beta-lactamase superfamily II)